MNSKKIIDKFNNYHSKTINETLNELKTNIQGLSKEEAQSRLNYYGLNELPEKKKKHPVLIFLSQFKNLLIYILIGAAILAYLFHKVEDAIIIITVIIINASIGFIQQFKAEKAIQALKRLVQPYAKVFRKGELIKIKATELVKGDIIILDEGDRVPADARIIECKNLSTQESSLTGESFPITKTEVKLPLSTVLADKRNMLWMSTFITSGYAKAVVTYTGEKTIIGLIAKSIEDIGDVKEHFQIKTDVLAKQMGVLAIISAIIILFVGYLRQIKTDELILFSLSSLISGIPEGLPAVLVVVLAIGATRMANNKAIIRKLASTETLGIVSTIITDKTGTLTQNTMNVESIVIPGLKEITVTGRGLMPAGDFLLDNKEISPIENEQLDKLLRIAGVCNNSRLITEDNQHKIIGDPTEGALIVLSEKAGLKRTIIEASEKRIDDLPFNAGLKLRASLVELNNQKRQLYVIGAPEELIKKSASIIFNSKKIRIDDSNKSIINKSINHLTAKAQRVLCLAYKDTTEDKLNERLLNKLIIVGFVGITDPIRPEVPEAVAKARKAGIRVVMCTGDHKTTAIEIAKQAGIITSSEPVQALTESDLAKLSDNEFSDAVSKVNVFARLTPETKLRIASELQKMGEIVAMTGDGVNDAPALKKADIGIAMGIIGTDVAKEASEMILADDNFATIVNAIEEGRIAFDNTRKTSYYLITTNFAESLALIATISLGMPLPLLPSQILWLNLVNDGLSDIALATEPGHGDILNDKPKSFTENIISKGVIPHLVTVSVTISLLVLFFFNNYVNQDLDKARTIAFSVITFSQLWRLLGFRSLKLSIFKTGFFTNKYINLSLIASFILYFTVIFNPVLQGIFKFVPLTIIEILIIILSTSTVLWISELLIYLNNKKLEKRNSESLK